LKIQHWLAFIILNSQLSSVQAQCTAFTCQERLNNGGAVANGRYDVQIAKKYGLEFLHRALPAEAGLLTDEDDSVPSLLHLLSGWSIGNGKFF
jgi:hypothetical protein